MRRNTQPNTRYRSQSICVTNSSGLGGAEAGGGATSPGSSPLRNNAGQSHHYSYEMRSESTCSSPSATGRRESLVKPTWQNIRPGQIPVKTLEKINGITSDSDNDDGEQTRRCSLNYAGGGGCIGGIGNGNINPSNSNGGSHQQQQQQQQQNQHHSQQQQQRQQQQQQQQQSQQNSHPTTSGRKHSTSNLGQLTRKGSLVVHRDSLSHGSSKSRQSIDSTASAASLAQSTAANTKTLKTPGRSLVRMFSDKCTTAQGSDEDLDYDFMAKVSTGNNL